MIDYFYKNNARRINARFKPETILRHEEKWMNALAKRHYQETADKALAEFQAGTITQYEWNRLQSNAVRKFFNEEATA